jgi:hypothetical protein
MAAKKSNTLVWLAALGVGGYLLYEYQQKQAAANTTVPNASTGILTVVPTAATANNTPNMPVSNSPVSQAINVTGLVPATVTNGLAVLQPGQTLAVNANNAPILNNAGFPLVFPSNFSNKGPVLLSGLYDGPGDAV